MDYSKRPALHFTAPMGWINDPNGTVWQDGEYHLFYQHFPDSLQWGPMHWGHAVSRDLVNWEHLPIALCPDELGMIFSGSAVIDAANTSGFGQGQAPMVAAFTHHGGDGERQSIAYSLDRGRTFEKYCGNPVVAEQAFKDFRDPRVFRHEPTGKWVMVVAAGDRARFYNSSDLKRWELAGEFGPVEALGGAVWECPDLFELPYGDGTAWVFSLSVTSGGPGGGNGVMYFTGSFDGRQFIPDGEPKLADYGRDFYAPITFSGAPGRAVWVGWMNCWPYSADTPAKVWRGMMSLPRELSLVDGREGKQLVQQPVREITELDRTGTIGIQGMLFGENNRLQYGSCGSAFQVDGELEEGQGTFCIELFSSLVIYLDTGRLQASIERKVGENDCSNALFTGERLFAPLESGVPLAFTIIVDRNAVEIFLQLGRTVLSALTYPMQPGRDTALYAVDGQCLLKRLAISKFQA